MLNTKHTKLTNIQKSKSETENTQLIELTH